MWYLLRHSDGKRLYLKPCKEVAVGRKKGTILIPDDESLSKLHASICVQPKIDIKLDEPVSTCIVRDEGSRYGTYIIKDSQKIEVTKEGYELSSQDVIRFGLQNSLFTAIYVPLITVISSLNDEDKSTLQNLMDHLDGLISSERTNDCTHLTVSKATLTEKVTWALVSAIPIVTVAYWIEVQRAVNNNEELPKPDPFIPAISESLVDKGKLLLHPNHRRKTLFKNLIFVHFSINQYKIYGKLIHLAGGKPVLYTKKPLTPRELCSPNVIVLQYPGDETTQSTQRIIPEYESISQKLQEYHRKMIAESEIPLAILHCSVEKYCNPKFRFSRFFKRSGTQVGDSKTIVIDTQDVDVPSKSNDNITKSKNAGRIIPETNDSFSSQQLTNSTPSQSFPSELICSTPIINNNKSKSNVNSNILATKSSKQNAEHSKEDAVCIPETYDSFLSNVTSLDWHSSTPGSISINDGKNENIESLKPSTGHNNKPRIKEIIHISQDDDVFARIQSNTSKLKKHSKKVASNTRDTQPTTNSGSIQSNTNEGNERLAEATVSKKTDTLTKTKSDPVQPNTDKINERLTEITVFKKRDTMPTANSSSIQPNTNKRNERLAEATVSKKTDTLTKTKSDPVQPNTDKINERLTEITVFKKRDTMPTANSSSIQPNTNKGNERLNEATVSKNTDTLTKTRSGPAQSNTEKMNERLNKVTVSEKTDTLTKTKNSLAQLNTDKVNERLNEIAVFKKTDTLLKVNTGPTEVNANKVNKRLIEGPLLKKSDTLSKTNDSAIRKTSIKKASIKENIVVVCSSDDESADGTESSTVKPITKKDNIFCERGIDSHKRDIDDELKLKRRRIISDTNDGEPVLRKHKQSTEQQENSSKRKHLCESVTNNSVPEISKTSRFECENSSPADVDRQRQVTINFKKFKKAPVIIPKERIGPDKMYVWQKNMVLNI